MINHNIPKRPLPYNLRHKQGVIVWKDKGPQGYAR